MVKNLRDCMIAFDDTCGDFLNKNIFVKLATTGRPKKVHVSYVKQKLIQLKKQSHRLDLSTTRLNLFKSPRDIQQIDYLG